MTLDSTDAVRVRGLRKTYGDHTALDGVDLTVTRGEVLALLGPNGAGKTTLVEILEGHRHADAGSVSVLGFDPAKRERAFRARIGIVLQETGLDQAITVREAVELYSAAYPHPRDADEVLALVGLHGREKARAKDLSGGQRRRLDLALGIAGDPELIFLDEPTTGFDPAARRQSWELIAGLRELGKTIFLTTHYMDEAQHLADRVVVLAQRPRDRRRRARRARPRGRRDRLLPRPVRRHAAARRAPSSTAASRASPPTARRATSPRCSPGPPRTAWSSRACPSPARPSKTSTWS